MDLLNNNFNELDSTNSQIKQLYRDDDKAKNFITDYNNNINETDIYGRKVSNFLPKITGFMSGAERRKLYLIKSQNNSASPSNNNSINLNNTNDNAILTERKEREINYYPCIHRLDGFNYFPRPISNPFVNIPEYQMKKKMKRILKKEAKKYYIVGDKKIKDEQNNKIGLSYITKDLNEYDIREKDKQKIFNQMDKNIEELKQEYKLKLSALDTNSSYISMKKFRNKIILAKKNEITYNEPPKEIKHKYHILKNIMKNSLLRRKNEMNKKEKNYINKYLKDRKSVSIDSKKPNFKKIPIHNIFNKRKKNEIIGPDKLNDICRSQDFSIGRFIKMDFGSFSYEEKDKKKLLSNNNTSEISVEENKVNNTMNILPVISSNNSMINNKSKESMNYLDRDTAETLTRMNRNNTDANIIDERIEDELSFISHENDNNNKNSNIYEKTNIRMFKYLKNNYEREKELLEGIKVETPKEEGIMPPVIKKPILKNNGELYNQDLAVLKLTNPYKFEQMEKKEESDMKFLRKKLEDTRKKYENSLKK